tara:strand:+ start:171 stop:2207 length:2037 start_codon:yes stop_codon:yes gene_type:complete
MKKIVAIIQARATSKRLKNKVLKKINNLSVAELIYARLLRSKKIDEVVFCTPKNKENSKLNKHLKKINAKIFTGSENNVLKRFYFASKKSHASTIVRITCDCPFVDVRLIDGMLDEFRKFKNVDYYTNTFPVSYPDGLDIEIFNFKALQKVYKNTKNLYGKEHVTTYFRKKGKFSIRNKKYFKDFSFLNVSINTREDLLKIRRIFKFFKNDKFLSILKLFKGNKYKKFFSKEIQKNNELNNKVTKGQKLWSRAKKIIPGGNMLLSKNPDRYIPKLWPSYFNLAKGCKVTDLDNNQYIDTATMGVGTNILGYSNIEVDKAVKKIINQGNMSTLNCPEEVYLSEKLVELHPWFHMVKYARSGGEANSIAIRIARAASGRDNVAICGYHGWHDWYLSTNLNTSSRSNLDTHLIQGLEVKGVPKKLKNTVFPFDYGDLKKLNYIIKNKNIGVIKMEVCRNTRPDLVFLRKVRSLATKNNIVLIFDECTTGFRESFGGIHKKINIIPDMAIFGKALGNGYAIAAILGKKNVMENASRSFISSTFWTERIGPTAALKTLEIMKKTRSWEVITKIGVNIQKRWFEMFKFHDLKVNIRGIPTLSNFIFESENHNKYKTLITQEMLKRNFLASNTLYPCTMHKKNILEKYFDSLEKILPIIKNCEEGSDIRKYLKAEVKSSDFKRFN